MIRLALLIAVALFPVSEIALAILKRSHSETARSEDKGSMRILWLSIAVGVGLAIAAQWVPSTRLPGPGTAIRILALVLLLCGLTLRWAAILALGRFFTVDVAIDSQHSVVRSGLYRFIRHPSYVGLLIAFLGLGVFFANWMSVLGLMVPITIAVLNRVAKRGAGPARRARLRVCRLLRADQALHSRFAVAPHDPSAQATGCVIIWWK